LLANDWRLLQSLNKRPSERTAQDTLVIRKAIKRISVFENLTPPMHAMLCKTISLEVNFFFFLKKK
jgi:hypothetical protein